MSDEPERNPEQQKWIAIENIGCSAVIAIVIIVWLIVSNT